MNVLVNTIQDFICGECKSFMYIETVGENQFEVVKEVWCKNKDCKNYAKKGTIKLVREEIEIKEN